MSLMDELFKGGSEEKMDFIKKMATLAAVAEMKREGTKITAMELEITVDPLGVSAQVTGSKALAEKLGLEDAVKDFATEIKPIAEKYSALVTSRVKEVYFGGGIRQTDRPLRGIA